MKTFLSGESFSLGEILLEIYSQVRLSPLKWGLLFPGGKLSLPVRAILWLSQIRPELVQVYNLDPVAGGPGAILAPTLSFS